jgi:hypothetical protein
VLETIHQYRAAVAGFAGMNNMEVWYSHLEIESFVQEYASQFKSKTVSARSERSRRRAPRTAWRRSPS